MKPVRICIVAGEESGDTYGAELARALRDEFGGPDALDLVGLGGPKMAAAGVSLRHDLVCEAVMGFGAVLARLPYFARLLRETEGWLADFRPDLLIPIDYPGFNLRLAARAKARGIPVLYYVSPQVWAWRPGRIRKIARVIDRMLLLFPFEVPLYEARGVPCECVGHPLADAIARHRDDPEFERLAGLAPGDEVVALLPGSRRQVIRGTLPTMVRAAAIVRAERPSARFLLPYPQEGLRPEIDRHIAGSAVPVTPVLGRVREVLARARGAMVASGTATLETLAYGVPMVVLYRASLPIWLISRLLLSTPGRRVAIVNLLAGEELVKEHVSWRLRPDAVARDLLPLLGDTPARETQVSRLRSLKGEFLRPGASARVARAARRLIEGSPAPEPLPQGEGRGAVHASEPSRT